MPSSKVRWLLDFLECLSIMDSFKQTWMPLIECVPISDSILNEYNETYTSNKKSRTYGTSDLSISFAITWDLLPIPSRQRIHSEPLIGSERSHDFWDRIGADPRNF